MNKIMLVFLTGTSSIGKSSILSNLPAPYNIVSVDELYSEFREKMLNDPVNQTIHFTVFQKKFKEEFHKYMMMLYHKYDSDRSKIYIVDDIYKNIKKSLSEFPNAKLIIVSTSLQHLFQNNMTRNQSGKIDEFRSYDKILREFMSYHKPASSIDYHFSIHKSDLELWKSHVSNSTYHKFIMKYFPDSNSSTSHVRFVLKKVDCFIWKESVENARKALLSYLDSRLLPQVKTPIKSKKKSKTI